MLNPFSHEQSLPHHLVTGGEFRKHVPKIDRAGDVEALLDQIGEVGKGHRLYIRQVVFLCGCLGKRVLRDE